MTTKTKRKKKFWYQDNQDARGYAPNDNRAVESINDRREAVRRTWNI